MIQVITDHEELKKTIGPLFETMGKAFPAPGCVGFVEIDEAGEVASFQVLQNALFAEGLYARDGNAHLRSVWHRMRQWIKEQYPHNEGMELLVMADSEKVAHACELMKCTKLDWQIFKRKV